MKALVNLVILQLIIQINFSTKDKMNLYGVEFYYSGTNFPRIDEITCFRYDLLPTNKFDHIHDCLNTVDNLLDQFDMLINKSN